MIGNDLVDLRVASQESNWRRPGFLPKVFTPHEQALIEASPQPDWLVWLLWSMKESVYKLRFRETRERLFAPSQLACTLHSIGNQTASGEVFHGQPYQTTSCFTDHYIHTITYSTHNQKPDLERVLALESPAYSQQHHTVQRAIRRAVSQRLLWPEEQVLIQKDTDGVPTLCLEKAPGQRVLLPLSISHHGYYGAFAIGSMQLPD